MKLISFKTRRITLLVILGLSTYSAFSLECNFSERRDSGFTYKGLSPYNYQNTLQFTNPNNLTTSTLHSVNITAPAHADDIPMIFHHIVPYKNTVDLWNFALRTPVTPATRDLLDTLRDKINAIPNNDLRVMNNDDAGTGVQGVKARAVRVITRLLSAPTAPDHITIVKGAPPADVAACDIALFPLMRFITYGSFAGFRGPTSANQKGGRLADYGDKATDLYGAYLGGNERNRYLDVTTLDTDVIPSIIADEPGKYFGTIAPANAASRLKNILNSYGLNKVEALAADWTKVSTTALPAGYRTCPTTIVNDSIANGHQAVLNNCTNPAEVNRED